MRENLARLIVISTGILVIILSMLFARIQNPDPVTPGSSKSDSAKPSPGISDQAATGKQLFQQQACVRCHSFKTHGNQQGMPLDGIAKKYTTDEIHDWIIGSQNLKGKMSPGIMKIKSRYQALPQRQLDDLVKFLQQD